VSEWYERPIVIRRRYNGLRMQRIRVAIRMNAVDEFSNGRVESQSAMLVVQAQIGIVFKTWTSLDNKKTYKNMFERQIQIETIERESNLQGRGR